jgi:hypothetical protein
VIKLLHQFPAVLNEAATKLDPSSLANHTYELVKAYNSFYQSVPVMKEEDADKRAIPSGPERGRGRRHEEGHVVPGHRVCRSGCDPVRGPAGRARARSPSTSIVVL